MQPDGIYIYLFIIRSIQDWSRSSSQLNFLFKLPLGVIYVQVSAIEHVIFFFFNFFFLIKILFFSWCKSIIQTDSRKTYSYEVIKTKKIRKKMMTIVNVPLDFSFYFSFFVQLKQKFLTYVHIYVGLIQIFDKNEKNMKRKKNNQKKHKKKYKTNK